MANVSRLLVSVFSPRILAKAIATFDKSTAIVVGSCWAAAVISLILASLSVHASVTAKKEAAEAMVAEPVLPVMVTNKISQREVQSIVDRLQKQFPDIKLESDSAQQVIMRSEDGAKFHQWITAISYLDAMAPQYRWTLREFCVGHCQGTQDLMRAMATGQRVTFAPPERK